MANHLKPGKKTPDVGSESGYISACLSMMVAPYGLVVGVEHVVTALKYPSNQAKSKMLQQASSYYSSFKPTSGEVYLDLSRNPCTFSYIV